MLTSFVKSRPLLAFFTLTYAFAVMAFVPQGLYKFGLLRLNAFSWYALGTLFSPSAAALIVQWLTERNLRVCRIYDSRKTLALGLGIGPVLILVSTVVIPSVVATKNPLHTLNWRSLLSATSYHCQYSGGLIGILLAPVVEEPGWRGFALPRLQAFMSPAWASILLGFLWSAWHFQTFLVEAPSEILRYSSIVVALSILMTLGFNLSRFSILVSFVMHAVINMHGCLIEALAPGAQERAHGSVIRVLALFIVPAAAILLTRGRLGTPVNVGNGVAGRTS